jgi:hypothetical protein
MVDTRILWPFPVNWDDPWRVTYGFKTDISVSRSGREHRRADRQTPRKTVEFSSLLGSKVELQAFNWLMTKVQNRLFLIPEYSRKATLSTATVNGDTAFTIAGTPPAWIYPGAELMLSVPTVTRLVAVQSVSGSTVTCTANVGAWAAGSNVHPALTGNLAPKLSAPRTTNAVAQVGVVLNVVPGSEVYAPAPAARQFAGLDVFDFQPNWVTAVDTDHLWPVEMVDYGVGRVAFHRPVNFPSRLVTPTFVGRSSEQTDALIDAFLRAKGRRGTFLYSTGEDDISPMDPLAVGGTSMKIAGTTVYVLFNNDPLFQALALRRFDGTTLYRSISSMTIVGGNTVLNLDAPWGENIALNQIAACSWLLSSRFASDDLRVEWISDEVGQMQMAIQSLPVPVPHDFGATVLTYSGAALSFGGSTLTYSS